MPPIAQRGCTVLVLLLSMLVPSWAGPPSAQPPDPLQSVMWTDLARRFFADAPVVFDDRVKVAVPSIVENQAQVPVTVDARALDGVKRLIVFADLNPIQHVLTLEPIDAAAFIAFRMKVEQATPVRAAALASSCGGCSAPSMARKDLDWSATVGQAQGRLWREADGLARLRVRIRHPMDTGLAKDNTPAFFIEQLEMRSSAGATLARLQLFEPVGEDPTLTLLLRLTAGATAVLVDGRDNNGAEYRSMVPVLARSSALDAASTRHDRCAGGSACP